MTILLRLLAVLIVLVTGAVAALEYSSLNWPSTTGLVERGSIVPRDMIFLGTKGKAIYSYEVNGKMYTSQRIGFGVKSSAVPVIGAKEPRQLREGDEVKVYYAPFYPGFSLLVTGPPATLVWWCAIAVLVFIMLWTFSNLVREPVF